MFYLLHLTFYERSLLYGVNMPEGKLNFKIENGTEQIRYKLEKIYNQREIENLKIKMVGQHNY